MVPQASYSTWSMYSEVEVVVVAISATSIGCNAAGCSRSKTKTTSKETYRFCAACKNKGRRPQTDCSVVVVVRSRLDISKTLSTVNDDEAGVRCGVCTTVPQAAELQEALGSAACSHCRWRSNKITISFACSRPKVHPIWRGTRPSRSVSSTARGQSCTKQRISSVF